MMKGIKNRFLLGLAAVIPIFLTLFVIWYLTTRIGGILSGVFSRIPQLSGLPEYIIALLGFFAVILLVYLVGFLATSLLGKSTLRLLEWFLKRIPLIRGIYSGARQLTNALFVDRSAFKKAVLVEFPRKGLYSIGFVTNEKGYKEGDTYLFSLFIPTTPNITTGFYILAREDKLIFLPFGVEKAFNILISGGVISVPEEIPGTRLGETRC